MHIHECACTHTYTHIQKARFLRRKMLLIIDKRLQEWRRARESRMHVREVGDTSSPTSAVLWRTEAGLSAWEDSSLLRCQFTNTGNHSCPRIIDCKLLSPDTDKALLLWTSRELTNVQDNSVQPNLPRDHLCLLLFTLLLCCGSHCLQEALFILDIWEPLLGHTLIAQGKLLPKDFFPHFKPNLSGLSQCRAHEGRIRNWIRCFCLRRNLKHRTFAAESFGAGGFGHRKQGLERTNWVGKI